MTVRLTRQQLYRWLWTTPAERIAEVIDAGQDLPSIRCADARARLLAKVADRPERSGDTAAQPRRYPPDLP